MCRRGDLWENKKKKSSHDSRSSKPNGDVRKLIIDSLQTSKKPKWHTSPQKNRPAKIRQVLIDTPKNEEHYQEPEVDEREQVHFRHVRELLEKNEPLTEEEIKRQMMAIIEDVNYKDGCADKIATILRSEIQPCEEPVERQAPELIVSYNCDSNGNLYFPGTSLSTNTRLSHL